MNKFKKKHNLTSILFITTVFLVVFVSTLSAEIVDKVIAKINNDIITLSEMKEMEASIKLDAELKKIDSLVLPKDILLNKMIEEILLVQYAKKKGIKVEDQDVYAFIDDTKKRNSLTDEMFEVQLERENMTLSSFKEKIRDQMLVSRLRNSEINSKIVLDEDEIFKFYNDNINDYMIDASVNVRQILLLTKDKDEDKVKLKAMDILEKIKSGADFIDMAKKYSEGSNSSAGGELGFFKKGTMVKEFEDQAFILKTGEVRDIIKSKFGFHIIKLIEKRNSRPTPFEEVKNRIKRHLFEHKTKKRYAKWIDEIKNSSFIDVLLTSDHH